jgi:hypothetical protein
MPPDPVSDLSYYKTMDEKINAYLTTVPQVPPDTKYIYSDINVRCAFIGVVAIWTS